uniref:Membrane protein n=1 Tax=uncultured organism TaxID=155900 RepID=M1PWE6_9ZZZZ|nr:membrane protein [uncultured organism]
MGKLIGFGSLSITFSEVYPVKLIVVSGLILGEVLFFALGSNYAFGLWYGVIIALGMNFLLVSLSKELLESHDKDEKISWRVSFLAFARFIIYGLALAVATLTEWLSFFAAAGGLILPLVALQLEVAFKNARFGG